MDSAMISDKRGTLVVVAGPTGSGKTEVGVELARRLGAPIISTDSRQVFRGMAVGTAQPSAEQQAAALHYFIADREVSDDYNAGRFEAEALELLDRLFVTHDYVLAVGGSGLYIDALCHGFDALPPAEPALRAQLEARLREEGLGSLLEELRRFDPVYYESVDRSNPSRVLRAVEVCIQTGRPYSEQRSGEPRERLFRILKIGIKVGREELYGRIDRRVDGMLASGLEESHRIIRNQLRKDPDTRPILLVLSDGRANAAPDGMKPMSAALEAARRIAADGRTHSLVIDVERQGLVQFAMAKTLSEGLEAEYMHLEELVADTLVRTLKDIL